MITEMTEEDAKALYFSCRPPHSEEFAPFEGQPFQCTGGKIWWRASPDRASVAIIQNDSVAIVSAEKSKIFPRIKRVEDVRE